MGQNLGHLRFFFLIFWLVATSQGSKPVFMSFSDDTQCLFLDVALLVQISKGSLFLHLMTIGANKDTLKASLKDFNIPTEAWEQAAQDRTKWRCLINKGASQFEAKRICEAERKRKERKARAEGPSSDSAQSEFTCSICNRQFRAKIGLYSHQRTHKHT